MNLEKLLDRDWRLANLYKIKNKQSQLVRFRPNYIQQIINSYTAPRKMILKPRQIGSTTNEAIKLLDSTIFNKNTTSCIMAHEADAIKKIFRIVRRAYNSMNPLMKPLLDRGGGSKYEMGFPQIDSLIYCDLESRGDTISRLHISEAGFVEYERFISTMQAVPINGHVTIESTANGVGNWFYDMWMEDNNYEKLFFPWFFDPTYKIKTHKLTLTNEEKQFIRYVKKTFNKEITQEQIAFRRNKQKEIKDYFLQEYPEDEASCFMLSGGAVISRQLILELLKEVSEPIEKDEGLEIFEKKNASSDYVIGADTALGSGKDYSVAVCYEVQTMKEVAILRVKKSPFDFARAVDWFARNYAHGHKVPIIGVENNNHGHAVLLELHEHLNYPRLFRHNEKTLGWTTNSVTRPIMVNQLIDSVSDRTVKINSKVTLNEFLTLVDNKGKIEAASGKNDDCVMATAIAVQLLKAESNKVQLYENVGQSILV